MVLFFLSWFTSPHTKPIDENLLNIKHSRMWKNSLSSFCAYVVFWGFPPSVKPWQCPFPVLCWIREGNQLPKVQPPQPWPHPASSLSQEWPQWMLSLDLLCRTWMNTDRPQRPVNEPQLPCGHFLLFPGFQQKECSVQGVLPEQFYLSPLVGADVPQGCSSPGAEEQGPVRSPAPLHLCHQGLEQGCDDSSAAGPALPTITLQTAVMATNDDVSVWNEE